MNEAVKFSSNHLEWWFINWYWFKNTVFQQKHISCLNYLSTVSVEKWIKNILRITLSKIIKFTSIYSKAIVKRAIIKVFRIIKIRNFLPCSLLKNWCKYFWIKWTEKIFSVFFQQVYFSLLTFCLIIDYSMKNINSLKKKYFSTHPGIQCEFQGEC